MMLRDKIINRESGITLYGITPPKLSTSQVRLAEISHAQIQRISSLRVDGLIIYDLQDEAARNAEDRPFPFIETLDPFLYSESYLKSLVIPKIIYRAVGKYNPQELTDFLEKAPPEQYLSVFVGAASNLQAVNLTIREAYDLKAQLNNKLLLGGVVIPERHANGFTEHLRVFSKISSGCKFFISQGVYNLDASKNFLSDYYYYAREHNIPMVPIIFTLTPCGSLKTLQFMQWLGISIPKWLENELKNSSDILSKSIDLSKNIWLELKAFAAAKGIPVGRNIESVSIRKEEIDASIELLKLTE
jgi:hypothetical protein